MSEQEPLSGGVQKAELQVNEYKPIVEAIPNRKINGAGSSSEPPLKKKRGRPRKYGPDAKPLAPLAQDAPAAPATVAPSAPAAAVPFAFTAPAPPPAAAPAAAESADPVKKRRGRPRGSSSSNKHGSKGKGNGNGISVCYILSSHSIRLLLLCFKDYAKLI